MISLFQMHQVKSWCLQGPGEESLAASLQHLMMCSLNTIASSSKSLSGSRPTIMILRDVEEELESECKPAPPNDVGIRRVRLSLANYVGREGGGQQKSEFAMLGLVPRFAVAVFLARGENKFEPLVV